MGRNAIRIAILVAASSLVSAVPGLADAAAPYVTYRAETETFAMAGGSVVTDTSANAGKAVVLKTGTAMWRPALTPDASAVALRVKANPCGKPIPVSVREGSTVLATFSVTDTSWREVTATSAVAGGQHAFGVWFDKDGVTVSGCTRTVTIDTFLLRSSVAINQGVAGSICQPTDLGLTYTKPPAPYSTTALGTGTLGYYETAPPSTGMNPVGVMMLIHGGAWYTVGPTGAQTIRDEAERWRASGWKVVNISSARGCGSWIDDALWFYDRIRTLDPGLPVCTFGESAGGHVALMVAARRDDVGCAIADGAPTDLVTLGQQPAIDPATGTWSTVNPTKLWYNAIGAFGAGNLGAMSPARLAADIDARVSAGAAARDAIVPPWQSIGLIGALDTAHPSVAHELSVLATGTTPFVHAPVSSTALAALRTVQQTIAAG